MPHTVKAVKGKFFGTPYWTGKMKLASVARDILPPNDPFWDPIFDPSEGAQRELNRSRVTDKMVPYLLHHSNPFFSAITVVLVPIDGDNLVEGRDYRFVPDQGTDSETGTLTIEDQVSLFPADGQHRREAIAQAFAERRGIHSEEVPVVFVPFSGPDRVRQMFADLNLHAKPANKSIGLAYEGRDPVVIIAKRLTHEVTLFDTGKRVNMKSNSLPAKSPAVISLNTLVEGTQHILGALLDTEIKDLRKHPELEAIANLDPSDPKVKEIARRVADVWNVVVDAFPQWTEVLEGHRSPAQLRDGVKNEAGEIVSLGYVFPFGLGWQALALVAAAILRVEGDDWSEALQRAIKSVDWVKGDHWNGIAMVKDRVNNTGPGIRATAGYVLKEAGYGETEDDDIQGLLAAYEKPEATLAPAA
jgi:DNA sulfur modification protein DndB